MTGLWHSLALNDCGEVFTWGGDTHGQLGLESADKKSQSIPKRVKGLASVSVVQYHVATGLWHSLALNDCGEVFTWGGDTHGQLGLESADKKSQSIPKRVKGLASVSVVQACAGYSHCLVLTSTGELYTWGNNEYGQMGINNSNTTVTKPQRVESLVNLPIALIACGANHSFVLSKSGKRHTLTFIPSVSRLYAFGIGSAVQLDSPKSVHKTPQLIHGPWIASPVAMTAGEDSLVSHSGGLVVKKIYSGGDHSIVTVTKSSDGVLSDDFRVLNPATQILDVNFERLKECEREVEQLKSDETLDQDLLLYLETVFLSPGCMNGSFLQVENDEHFSCNSKNPGVDMQLCQDCYDTIARIERESVRSLILASHAHLVKSLWNTPPDAEALRMFLTLPLYHEFMNPRQHEILHMPFAGALLQLKNEAAKILGNWYLLMSDDYFERLILIFKQCLIYLLQQPGVVDSTNGDITFNRKLSFCLQVLQKLNSLNNETLTSSISAGGRTVSNIRTPAPHGGRKVAYTAFYMPDLATVCDIRIDYFRWISGRPNGSTRDFLCNYPFIFDAKAKTTLLEMDQRIQMEHAMNQTNFYLFLQTFNPHTLNQYLEVEVSRDNIVEDTIRELAQYTTNDFKKPLKVKFRGEEAEDAGGVRREFLMLLLKEILDPKYGMFKEYEETRSIWFSEDTFEDQNMYFLIGTLCGLAIYNYTIINTYYNLFDKVVDRRRNWYLLMSDDYFERLILIFKQCLIYLLQQPGVVDSTNGDITFNRKLSLCLQVLQKLNSLNNETLTSSISAGGRT
ncbi:probable E3 ubiquitin-protein ligase HERC4, partial [Diaphorina citri]|uniref:Probable E3 ubiquitin-protein ligase HERC4 n=1 Tax=Diaphorina citri TaxID=121845 RepID=A0A3Q0IQT0_DIACI